jgi:hypothetical protein
LRLALDSEDRLWLSDTSGIWVDDGRWRIVQRADGPVQDVDRFAFDTRGRRTSSVARYLIPLSSTTTGVKASKLNYNALTRQYTYLWVTDKSWAGSCRRLTLRFTDENIDRVLDVEFVR